MSNIERKLHNPKSHAPAVYIPCWLIQVSTSLLSNAAKILYGRLSQWSTAKGTVHRSIWQLSKETGICPRSVQRTLKELKDAELIGTYQVESGGINHYQFYDHPWMHEPINEHLVYHESYPQPPTTNLVPPTKFDATPTTNLVPPPTKNGVPKIKEIKVNKTKSFYEEQKINSNSKASQEAAPAKPETEPRTKEEWREENAKVHNFADSKNQMAREAKQIEEHENIKRAPMPDSLRQLVKNWRRP